MENCPTAPTEGVILSAGETPESKDLRSYLLLSSLSVRRFLNSASPRSE
ncbi:MAG: hypothetical protein IJO72_01000 [Oscillospiraceae bacterium]|nr:hypothetical protein [Oscillospiraceae bacterium]